MNPNWIIFIKNELSTISNQLDELTTLMYVAIILLLLVIAMLIYRDR
jgi:hypothetical protein